MNEMPGSELRRQRVDAGLSQRELAARSGVPQPNIAAYERGRRTPTAATRSRLDAVLLVPTLSRIRRRRSEILAAAEGRGLTDVRVFGSVARGGAHLRSDVDLLVHPAPHASRLDLAGFMDEVAQLLGHPIDVVSDRGSGPAMARIRNEAVAL